MLHTKLLFSSAIFALSTFANATVIDFNHLAHNDTFQTFNSIKTNGFVIKNDSQGSDRLGIWGKNDEFQADTKLLESNVTQLNIRSPDAEKMK
jgi:hypothetical protein